MTGTIATSLTVLNHVSRIVDASAVAELAASNDAGLIVIGQSYDDDGQPSYEGRRAGRFAEALRTVTPIPIAFWDEAFTTSDARANRLRMGAPRKNRSGHLDSLAAAILLQSYLDAEKSK
jgi:putative Holliday junction resolvase